ncbi:MAG: GNAT family N-acetyltransferase [Candidatus Pacearchaeota archaeon]
MEIRNYKPSDYESLRHLYQSFGWFDESVDSKDMINKQIKKDPGCILVALSNDKVIGTITMLATGRLALFFRLISQEESVRKELLKKGEEFFIKKGYKRIDIVAPEEDEARHKEYVKNGFNKGNPYRWFWKEK